jgi:hypothetical protein
MPAILTARDHLRSSSDLGRVDVIALDREQPAASGHSHYHLLNRGVARALADPVHRHLNLPRATHHARQSVRRRQAKVVVAVRRENDVLCAGSVLLQVLDEVAVFATASTSTRNSGSERPASSGENSISAPVSFANLTMAATCSMHSDRVILSLTSKCRSEVARKVWMRWSGACRTAS